MDASDLELIEQYRGHGCQTCLDTLVQRHLARVRSLIFPMVGNSILADDLTQETFFRAIRGLPSFRGQAQFGTWLAQIAVNVVREHHRNRLRRKTYASDGLGDATSPAGQPDQTVQSEETLSDIQSALLELPDAWREAIILVCIEGHSASEAAQIASCSITTLYWRIHQSRKKLKKRLADHL